MFYGLKYYNDLLMEAGPEGNVQSEILLQKDQNTFTFKQGWAFPRKVYFNGDECKMPHPDDYPHLPNSAPKFAERPLQQLLFILASFLVALQMVWELDEFFLEIAKQKSIYKLQRTFRNAWDFVHL